MGINHLIHCMYLLLRLNELNSYADNFHHSRKFSMLYLSTPVVLLLLWDGVMLVVKIILNQYQMGVTLPEIVV